MHPHLLSIPLPWGGTFTVATYGFAIMCGFLLALYVAQRRAKRFGIDPAAVFDAAIGALVAGIVGARLLFVIYEWDTFRAHPEEIPRIDKGGLVFLGGAIAGVLALIVVLRRRRAPLMRSLDVMASIAPLAHAFGRFGCFMNGCCFGKVTHSWLGVQFPRVADAASGAVVGSPAFITHLREGLILESAEWSLPVHPTQLYAIGYNLLIFAVLTFYLTRRRREGQVGWLYLVLYGSFRFANEAVRVTPPVVLGMSPAQAMCVPLIVIGAVMLLKARKLPPQPLPEPWQPPQQEAADGARS